MPVVKQHNTSPMIRDAVVLDLGDLGRQAARLRAAAEAKAQRILEDAKAQADQIIAAAHQQGYDAGYEKGQVQGGTDGHEAGRAEALAQGTTQVKQTTDRFLAMSQEWHEHRTQLDREARGAVLDFAIKLAGKLTHRIVQVDPAVVGDQVAAALSRVLEPTDVLIRIHPEDRPVVQEVLPDVLAGLSHLKEVSLHDDDQVGRGGCVLAFRGGQVDASLSTQMTRIVQTLVPEGQDAVECAEVDAHVDPHVAPAVEPDEPGVGPVDGES